MLKFQKDLGKWKDKDLFKSCRILKYNIDEERNKKLNSTSLL